MEERSARSLERALQFSPGRGTFSSAPDSRTLSECGWRFSRRSSRSGRVRALPRTTTRTLATAVRPAAGRRRVERRVTLPPVQRAAMLARQVDPLAPGTPAPAALAEQPAALAEQPGVLAEQPAALAGLAEQPAVPAERTAEPAVPAVRGARTAEPVDASFPSTLARRKRNAVSTTRPRARARRLAFVAS